MEGLRGWLDDGEVIEEKGPAGRGCEGEEGACTHEGQGQVRGVEELIVEIKIFFFRRCCLKVKNIRFLNT